VQQRAAGRSAPARAPLTARSTAAREAYLRGRQLWQEGRIAESIAELREATRLEPEFVLPYIALAESTHAQVMGGKLDPRTGADEIRRASDAAYRLAPALAQTHATRAMLAFWYDWRFDDAEESYREAIRLDPGQAGALHDHGWLLIARGKLDEGIAEIRRAQELDPLSPRANTHVAWAYIYSRRYEDAEREARRALTLEPGFREAFACLHQIELLRGSKQADSGIDPRHPYRNAARLALQGDRSGAIAWLTKAKENRDTQFVLAAADPKLVALHDDPRFVELLRSVGLAPVGGAGAAPEAAAVH
jgi:tetratricopeptide (TPR) repeat protein